MAENVNTQIHHYVNLWFSTGKPTQVRHVSLRRLLSNYTVNMCNKEVQKKNLSCSYLYKGNKLESLVLISSESPSTYLRQPALKPVQIDSQRNLNPRAHPKLVNQKAMPRLNAV